MSKWKAIDNYGNTIVYPYEPCDGDVLSDFNISVEEIDEDEEDEEYGRI